MKLSKIVRDNTKENESVLRIIATEKKKSWDVCVFVQGNSGIGKKRKTYRDITFDLFAEKRHKSLDCFAIYKFDYIAFFAGFSVNVFSNNENHEMIKAWN